MCTPPKKKGMEPDFFPLAKGETSGFHVSFGGCSGKNYSSSHNHGSVENGSLEDEFSLQRGHFPLPGLLEKE